MDNLLWPFPKPQIEPKVKNRRYSRTQLYVTVSTETGTYVGTRLRGDGHIRRYPSPRRRSHTYVFVSKRMPVQSVGSDCTRLVTDDTINHRPHHTMAWCGGTNYHGTWWCHGS